MSLSKSANSKSPSHASVDRLKAQTHTPEPQSARVFFTDGMDKHLDYASEVELAKVNEFLELAESLFEDFFGASLVKDALVESHTIVRFLRNSGSNPKVAVQKFREALEWRKGIDADEALYWHFSDCADMKEHFPNAWHGMDRMGRPITLVQLGRMSVHKLLETADIARVLRFHTINMEFLYRVLFPMAHQEHGHPVHQVLCVMDLEGFHVSRHLNRASMDLQKAVNAMQEHYPDTLGPVVFINAPRLFNWAWKGVRMTLSKRTRDKITVVGKDYHSTLAAHIAPEQLPRQLGGTCECATGCIGGHRMEHAFRTLCYKTTREKRSLAQVYYPEHDMTYKRKSSVNLLELYQKEDEGRRIPDPAHEFDKVHSFTGVGHHRMRRASVKLDSTSSATQATKHNAIEVDSESSARVPRLALQESNGLREA